jgi:Domain of unknown function (DUF4386)
MSTTTTVFAAPQRYARAGGGLYLLLIALGLFAEITRDSMIVPGDAAATAGRIIAGESLWRAGIGAELVAVVCALTLAMIYYVLLRPVSRELTILATFLRMVSLTVQTVGVFFLLAALYPFGPAPYLKAFTAEQQQVLARLAIRAHADGYGVALLVLGFCFLVHGYLIFRSGFLPRVLGRLIQLAGLSYLANSFALVLAPAVASRLFPLILLPAFVGELSLSLWLLAKGVDVVKWRALAPAPHP